MTHDTTHTPTPWHLEGQYICAEAVDRCLGVKDMVIITEMKPNHMLHAHTSRANAAHIVRCVNQHDDLIKCLNALLLVGEGWRNYLNQARDKTTGLGLYDLAQSLVKENV